MTTTQNIKVEVKGDRLHIDMPLEDKLKVSRKGSHKMVASTHGNLVTDLEYDGKKIQVQANAFTDL